MASPFDSLQSLTPIASVVSTLLPVVRTCVLELLPSAEASGAVEKVRSIVQEEVSQVTDRLIKIQDSPRRAALIRYRDALRILKYFNDRFIPNGRMIVRQDSTDLDESFMRKDLLTSMSKAESKAIDALDLVALESDSEKGVFPLLEVFGIREFCFMGKHLQNMSRRHMAHQIGLVIETWFDDLHTILYSNAEVKQCLRNNLGSNKLQKVIPLNQKSKAFKEIKVLLCCLVHSMCQFAKLTCDNPNSVKLLCNYVSKVDRPKQMEKVKYFGFMHSTVGWTALFNLITCLVRTSSDASLIYCREALNAIAEYLNDLEVESANRKVISRLNSTDDTNVLSLLLLIESNCVQALKADLKLEKQNGRFPLIEVFCIRLFCSAAQNLIGSSEEPIQERIQNVITLWKEQLHKYFYAHSQVQQCLRKNLDPTLLEKTSMTINRLDEEVAAFKQIKAMLNDTVYATQLLKNFASSHVETVQLAFKFIAEIDRPRELKKCQGFLQNMLVGWSHSLNFVTEFAQGMGQSSDESAENGTNTTDSDDDDDSDDNDDDDGKGPDDNDDKNDNDSGKGDDDDNDNDNDNDNDDSGDDDDEDESDFDSDSDYVGGDHITHLSTSLLISDTIDATGEKVKDGLNGFKAVGLLLSPTREAVLEQASPDERATLVQDIRSFLEQEIAYLKHQQHTQDNQTFKTILEYYEMVLRILWQWLHSVKNLDAEDQLLRLPRMATIQFERLTDWAQETLRAATVALNTGGLKLQEKDAYPLLEVYAIREFCFLAWEILQAKDLSQCFEQIFVIWDTRLQGELFYGNAQIDQCLENNIPKPTNEQDDAFCHMASVLYNLADSGVFFCRLVEYDKNLVNMARSQFLANVDRSPGFKKTEAFCARFNMDFGGKLQKEIQRRKDKMEARALGISPDSGKEKGLEDFKECPLLQSCLQDGFTPNLQYHLMGNDLLRVVDVEMIKSKTTYTEKLSLLFDILSKRNALELIEPVMAKFQVMDSSFSELPAKKLDAATKSSNSELLCQKFDEKSEQSVGLQESLKQRGLKPDVIKSKEKLERSQKGSCFDSGFVDFQVRTKLEEDAKMKTDDVAEQESKSSTGSKGTKDMVIHVTPTHTVHMQSIDPEPGQSADLQESLKEKGYNPDEIKWVKDKLPGGDTPLVVGPMGVRYVDSEDSIEILLVVPEIVKPLFSASFKPLWGKKDDVLISYNIGGNTTVDYECKERSLLVRLEVDESKKSQAAEKKGKKSIVYKINQLPDRVIPSEFRYKILKNRLIVTLKKEKPESWEAVLQQYGLDVSE